MRAPLGYGTNLHAAEGVGDIADALARFAGPLREQVGWATLGVDLRLGLAALGGDLAPLRRALDRHCLSAHTLNGFPLLPFQAAVVKTAAYHPDWADPARLRASLALLDAALALSDHPLVTISTSPGGWRGDGWLDPDRFAAALGTWAGAAARRERDLGRRAVLAIEPEPGCTLTTTADVIALWQGPLARHGLAAASAALDGDARAGAAALARHLGVCVDACHLAVMGEAPEAAVAALTAAGVPIAKCQASACPEADAGDPAAVAVLLAMAESRFLHQTRVTTAAGSAWLTDDLDQVPAALARLPGAANLRSHFHIPLHAEPRAPLRSTAAETARTVRACQAAGCTHLAVETYTWSLLASEPDALAGTAAELRWLETALAAG